MISAGPPRGAALTALALVACQPVTAIDLPPSETAKALVIVAHRGSELGEVFAVDTRDPTPVEARDGDTLHALAFSCSLERLGLQAGLQALHDSVASEELLPPPSSAFTAPFATGEPATWTPAIGEAPTVVTAALRRLQLPPNARCAAAGARYSPRVLNFPSDGRGGASMLLPVDERRVLAGSTDGRLYEIDIDGRITQRTDLEVPGIIGGAQATDGTHWLVTRDGAVLHGTIDDGFTAVPSGRAPFAGVTRAAVALPDDEGAPFELFIATTDNSTRTFARFDGRSWALLTLAPRWRGIFLPAVAWIGPGQAVAIGTGTVSQASVMRYDRGVLREEPVRGLSGLASILHHPTLGTIVGRDDAEGIDRFDGAVWRRMEPPTPINFVRVIWPEGDGFSYGGSLEINFSASAFSQYHPSLGFCSTYERYTDYAAAYVAPMGPRARVVVTAPSLTAPMGVTILDRTQEAASCSD